MKEDLYTYLYCSNASKFHIELLQYEINKRIFHHGENFRTPFPERFSLKNYLKDSLGLAYKIFNQKNITNKGPVILSNAYFTFNRELQKSGFQPFTPYWNVSKKAPYLKDLGFLIKTFLIDTKIKNSPFNEIVNDDFFNYIDDYRIAASKYIQNNNIASLIVCQDLGFHERLFIDIFKKLGRPTFMFTHGGIPVVYNGIDDNKADYLIVWGDAIKEKYITSGIDQNKILVSGHPNYQNYIHKKLRFSLDDILILTKAPQGAPSDSTKVTLFNRGIGIVYLLEIQELLMKLGVKKVRLRLHPSENPVWYCKYLDTNFFQIDRDDLTTSLTKSSLVIGGTSTVFLESIFNGVNYVVYEPTTSNDDIYGIPIRSPFNGADFRVPVFKNLLDLEIALQTKLSCNSDLIFDYFNSPFDISFLNKIIK